ncbi:hypothetical protein VNO77_34082 [Canavalia gladiata]|uniref:Uncharacterized protein n=1 Tax=Canavalia gladiata TaxID=3824 RepID=A0AAN9PY94_CANGL
MLKCIGLIEALYKKAPIVMSPQLGLEGPNIRHGIHVIDIFEVLIFEIHYSAHLETTKPLLEPLPFLLPKHKSHSLDVFVIKVDTGFMNDLKQTPTCDLCLPSLNLRYSDLIESIFCMVLSWGEGYYNGNIKT